MSKDKKAASSFVSIPDSGVQGVGSTVLFRPGRHDNLFTGEEGQWLAGVVAHSYVDDRMNLCAFDENGNVYPRTRVKVKQIGETITPEDRESGFCVFRPVDEVEYPSDPDNRDDEYGVNHPVSGESGE